MRVLRASLLAVVAVLLAVGARAQTVSTGAIQGVVHDATGSVLPGVSVEIASPALIEKTRVSLTDGQGNYKVTELPPGTYTVMFTLQGFNTVKREGILLNAGFTATVNAELRVGAVEETVVVTGASPVVDVQNVRSQQVMTAAVLDVLPSSSRDTSTIVGLTIGAVSGTAGRNDVGGDKTEMSNGIAIHGGRPNEARMNFDAMNTSAFYSDGGGNGRVWKFNMMAVQESVIDTGANGLDSETGGANWNMVPRDGGNIFSVHSALAFANHGMASGKVSNRLISRQTAPDQNAVKTIYDYGFGVGGPVARDRLWFYSSNRWWGAQTYAANNYFNKSADWRFYVPDLTRQAYTDVHLKDFGGRLTGQATAKQKYTLYVAFQASCNCYSQLVTGAL